MIAREMVIGHKNSSIITWRALINVDSINPAVASNGNVLFLSLPSQSCAVVLCRPLSFALVRSRSRVCVYSAHTIFHVQSAARRKRHPAPLMALLVHLAAISQTYTHTHTRAESQTDSVCLYDNDDERHDTT